MSVFGNILKEKREKMGYSIQDISEITTIQQRYIQALEDDNFENIPGDYYVRSFVKQYATILKLDSQKLIKKYEDYVVESNTKRPDVLLQDELRKPARPSEEMENDISTEMVETINEEMDIQTEIVEESAIELTEDVIVDEHVSTELDEIDYAEDEVDNIEPLILDGDGLEDAFIEEYIVGEENENTQTVAFLEVDEGSNEPTTKMSRKLIVLLSTMVIFMLGLIWVIPNAMSNFAPKQTATTTPTSTLAPTTTTTVQTTTTAQTTTTTTQTTTTTTQTTSVAPQPSHEPADLYVISSDVSQTTYGLGRGFAGYTGEYVVSLTASEPVWIRVDIAGQKVHEGTMMPNSPYRFTAYNNAGEMKIRVGLSSAIAVMFNGQPVHVPTYQRVQDYTFNFAR